MWFPKYWKKTFAILMVLVISVMAIPALVSADPGSPLTLVQKDPNTWQPISGATGLLTFNPSGPTFDYTFTATGLPDGSYSLIYYANPYPGNNPGVLIGIGTSEGGSLPIAGSPNLNMDLPTPPDSNILVDHGGPPDNYANHFGAKIWLVPTECYSATVVETSGQITSWQPTRFLFETNLINYTDTDKTGGGISPSPVSLTTTITEPSATIAFTVAPTTLDFGSVAIGSYSGERTVIIHNTGTVPIKITVLVSSGFYTDCMELSSGGGYTTVSGWVPPTVVAGSSLTVYTRVKPTAAYASVATGTLTFMAEYAP
jgi:hypothetical protein